MTTDLAALAPTDDLPAPCEASAAAVQARVDDILRPAGALARLDELAVWLAGWQRTERPAVERPVALIFAGDHGVVADGVSAYPGEVTVEMMKAFAQGRASVSAMASVAGATVEAIDVGVARPTGNIATEPAMSEERFVECFGIGVAAVDRLDADLLVIGEMGIGNTTAAAAVATALLDRPAEVLVGSGTGVDGDGRGRKVDAVTRAVTRAAEAGAGPDRPFEVLRQVGGTELVAMAGAIFGARRRGLPLLLDGYVTAGPALALHLHEPAVTAIARAGHRSAEPGHGAVLDALGLAPLLDLDLRLGEASGAVAALPLVQMACRAVTDVPTFAEWFGPADG